MIPRPAGQVLELARREGLDDVEHAEEQEADDARSRA